MVEREFAETFDTVEEDGIVESKIGGGFCVAVGGVTFGGRVGTNSKGGVHRMGRRNNVEHRPVRLIVAGVNTSWGRITGSAMMAVMRAGFCC